MKTDSVTLRLHFPSQSQTSLKAIKETLSTHYDELTGRRLEIKFPFSCYCARSTRRPREVQEVKTSSLRPELT